MKEETLIYHQQVLDKLRMGYASGKTKSLAFRIEQLKGMLRMFHECQDEFLTALHSDLRKSKLEAALYEIELCKTELRWLIGNLKKVCRAQSLPKNLLALLDRAYIRREPYGVVLVMGAWNYPVNLSVNPVAGAIAAGNCVLLKPSEVAAHSAAVMAKIMPRYLDADCFQIVLGEVEETKSLLDMHRFNYIFYTGSTNVGRIIMTAAARNLTPVTLELGGKTPVYIDDSANYEVATKRIIWAKMLNLGQTCISPDYILCSKRVEMEFVRIASRILEEWYGQNKQMNPDIPRIVNTRHFQRILKLLENTKGRIVLGGKRDEQDLWIEPTFVVDCDPNDSLMSEEIFGPILPFITINSPEEASAIINSKPVPLALYTFAKDEKMNEKMINGTASGGVCVNDCLFQNTWSGLPFGGLGDSGMGAYHQKSSIETFSHKRPVLARDMNYLSEKLGEPRYYPFSKDKLRFFKLVLYFFDTFNLTCSRLSSSIASALFGGFLVFVYFFWIHPKSVS